MKGISIIICTYNGSSRIGTTLEHILQLKTNVAWELIIVNNASTDNTEEICHSYLKQLHVPSKIVYEAEPGLSHARIRGLREAIYDYVLYCDDDNGLATDYLEIGYNIIGGNSQIGVLGGCGTPVFETFEPEWFHKYSHSYAVGPQASKDGKCSEFPAELYGACTFLIRKPLLDLFDRGFKTVLTGRKGTKLVSGDDVEWCYLLQLMGYEIWYDHRLKFTHIMPAGRLTWQYYLKLKHAITLGSAAFISYKLLFRNRQMNDIRFVFHYASAFLLAVSIWLKNLIWFSGKSEKDLSRMILFARMKSYAIQPIVAFRHFRQLKSVF